eukprot:COSAG01_NODE_4940_length_4608_cov_7.420936_8_plen_74_part_00
MYGILKKGRGPSGAGLLAALPSRTPPPTSQPSQPASNSGLAEYILAPLYTAVYAVYLCLAGTVVSGRRVTKVM